MTKSFNGFTLAEVLITLAIIGVVAAISIPSVVANTQQKEFQTGLRKAVSVLNSAITMNMALDGESPYENTNLYEYLMRHMSVMKSYVFAPYTKGGDTNASFYTTDGMRFEVVWSGVVKQRLYENPEIKLRSTRPTISDQGGINGETGGFTGTMDCKARGQDCSKCGSYGLQNNSDNTTNAPCLIVVDVNGDRKPFPKNASCYNNVCQKENIRKYGDPSGLHLTDTFPIMITDKQAIPYGQAAQKAMYQAQSKEKK